MSITPKEFKDKLLPCPFCGNKPRVSEGWGAPAGAGQAWTLLISCDSKRCNIHPQLYVYTTIQPIEKAGIFLRKQSLEKWNKRK